MKTSRRGTLTRWLIGPLSASSAALRDKVFSRLFDVAELASLDNIDKTNYIKAMTTARDTYNQIEYAKKTGLEEGLVRGRGKGYGLVFGGGY